MNDAGSLDRSVLGDRRRLSPGSYEVFADGELIYQGESAVSSWWACVDAAKKGAKRVSRFVDGTRVTFSWAV